MRIEEKLEEGIFIQRLSRFLALVDRRGKQKVVYLPNSGRIWDSLLPGQKVWLRKVESSGRKTSGDLFLVPMNGTLVCADARVPSELIFEALTKGKVKAWANFSSLKKEVSFQGSRLDFFLEGEGKLFLEVKSVTLVQEGRALFPDAPTKRGVRHLRSLMQAKDEGYDAAIIFVIQREDALTFSPYDDIDQELAEALRRAGEYGVRIYAFTSRVSTSQIELASEIPILL
jgi:sugar fermentation stimulation protein A